MGGGHLSPNDHSSSSEATTCISGSTINPRSMTNTATTLVDLQSKKSHRCSRQDIDIWNQLFMYMMYLYVNVNEGITLQRL